MRWLPILLILSCAEKSKDSGTNPVTPFDEPCSERTAERRVLWGDLHAHSSWSFDSGAYGSHLTSADGFAYAKGQTVLLPDETGEPTRPATIDRPLDFLAMTEHGEFLGEILICTDPSWPGYESETCRQWRDVTQSNGAFDFGVLMASRSPERFDDVCGSGSDCTDAARIRWNEIQRIANEADDRSSECSFTSFVAYEYTNTSDVSNLHRNVVFKSTDVPDLPVTHFEAPSPLELWRALDTECSGNCDVVVLPHNSNLSNGQLFASDPSTEGAADIARLRARMEPVAEIFQHKGDSECRNGFEGIDDEAECNFEKLRPPNAETCGENTGSGGMRLWGCVHKLDFLRNVLLEGLKLEQTLDLNPYRLGFIGSTDTHNATPGHVDSIEFLGHVGVADATPEARLGAGTVTHDTLENNPGGLAAVWAEENSRTAIFDALRRRETYATSGPRIELRLFGGMNLDASLCDASDRIAQLDAMAVPMGGHTAQANSFFIEAHADQTPLNEVQIIKGWIDASGELHQTVVTVSSHSDSDSTIDPTTCAQLETGSDRICTVWTDPNPTDHSFYYARVLENPTCRWSQRECNGFSAEDKPSGCTDSHVENVVQQRAWSSPIWIGSTN